MTDLQAALTSALRRGDVAMALNDYLLGESDVSLAAAAILAHPAMADLAREAGIGEAVEHLRAVLPLGWGASLNMTQGDDGHPYSVQVWNERVENVTDKMPDWCESIPDAVKAAIGEGDEYADPRAWRN